MQITSTKLEILQPINNTSFRFLGNLPIELYTKFKFNSLISPKQVISELSGQTAFEIQQATNLSEMQAILSELAQYVIERVYNDIEESTELTEYLLYFCEYEDGELIPNRYIIGPFSLAIFDHAHFLVYGQKIPQLLPVVQELLDLDVI